MRTAITIKTALTVQFALAMAAVPCKDTVGLKVLPTDICVEALATAITRTSCVLVGNAAVPKMLVTMDAGPLGCATVLITGMMNAEATEALMVTRSGGRDESVH